ncbi:hypothetical protein D3C81_1689930 [compost metagenome]
MATLALGQRHEVRDGAVDTVDEPLRLGPEALRMAGQRHPAGGAVEQPEAQHLLQLLDRRGQCGLGDVQPQRRGGERASLGNGQETAELLEGDVVTHQAGGAAGDLSEFGNSGRKKVDCPR